MKKKNLITSCLLLSGLVAGCSCNKTKVDTFANVSNENKNVISNKGNKFTVGEIYEYILANESDNISKTILLPILEKQINLNDQNMAALYKRYLNEYFATTFVENETYKTNGKFSEELLIEYLRSESYIVSCGEGISSGLLDNSIFSCNYSDYITKEVNYDIYMKMLKIKYIIEEKSNLIDKNNARQVTYYTIAKGSSDNEVREKLEEYVSSIKENYASTDDNVIKNLFDIGEEKRKEDLKKISDEYAYVSTSQDSSSGYTYLNKFTTCGNKRCSKEEGKEYQDNMILEKEYVTTKVVIKDNTEILYEAARNLLFSENINDYLYKVGDGDNAVYYLLSPAYISQEDKRINDIIHYNSNNYYLATVKVIDSQSSFNDKVAVAELLIDKISDSTIYDYCYSDLDVEIYDKNIREYFELKYGSIKD